MDKVLIITGQTATGKTALALKLAKDLDGELINFDSRQIYKHLDIITGKDLDLFKQNKIWLYDIVKPDQYFSSFDYVNAAKPIINKLLKLGKTPILVGGTYLYIKHLLYGTETENIPPDFKLRAKLKNKPLVELQKILESKNSAFFNKLNNSEKNNPQRLIRKIEIVSFTDANHRVESAVSGSTLRKYNIEFIGLKFKDKEKLRTVIEKRVEERVRLGAVEEVKKLLNMGYSEKDPGLNTIGYQQIIEHLRGTLSFADAIRAWINKEVQYAKRQLTFMKRDSKIIWKLI